MIALKFKSSGICIRTNEKRAKQLKEAGLVSDISDKTKEFPNQSWTISKIAEYAQENGISLDGITKKQDMLDVIGDAFKG